MKKMAEKQLGVPINKAVISVPAEFDERQRNYTIRAANLAGQFTTRFLRCTLIILLGIHNFTQIHCIDQQKAAWFENNFRASCPSYISMLLIIDLLLCNHSFSLSQLGYVLLLESMEGTQTKK